MSTLTDFLLARIAEDEEDARAADGPRWIHEDKVVTFEAFGPDSDYVDASAPIYVDTRANGRHIVRWSPARALAECEAKRQIVGYAAPADGPGRAWYQFTLLRLALPYAGHPDYDEAWRP